MLLDFELEIATHLKQDLPSQEQFHLWLTAALANECDKAELSIRIVDETESAELNASYRHKIGPTNVLSFPAEIPAGVPVPLLGDLVICAPVVLKEAQEQKKLYHAHFAHMTIHGVLHLLGYDHIKDEDAQVMEAKEIAILKQLGFPNPYQ